MIRTILSTAVAMILIGCTTPDVNPSNKYMIFEEGKPYAIPYGAKYGLYTKDMIEVFEMIKNLKSKPTTKEGKKTAEEMLTGANIALRTCKIGDVRWADPKSFKNQKSDLGKLLTHAVTFARGKAGCAKPLSKQEYDYYLARTKINTSNNNQSSSSSSPTRYKAPTYNFPSNNI